MKKKRNLALAGLMMLSMLGLTVGCGNKETVNNTEKNNFNVESNFNIESN